MPKNFLIGVLIATAITILNQQILSSNIIYELLLARYCSEEITIGSWPIIKALGNGDSQQIKHFRTTEGYFCMPRQVGVK